MFVDIGAGLDTIFAVPLFRTSAVRCGGISLEHITSRIPRGRRDRCTCSAVTEEGQVPNSLYIIDGTAFHVQG